jgi:hypothetical protein
VIDWAALQRGDVVYTLGSIIVVILAIGLLSWAVSKVRKP